MDKINATKSSNKRIHIKPLTLTQKWILALLSFLIVSLGQPLWSNTLGLISACVGFALFWRVLLDIPSAKKRFWLGTAWFGAVHMVQLEWMLSHPFFYIYGLVAFLGFIFGIQFGALCLFIKPSTLTSIRKMLGLAGFWIIMEWSRLFILSGYSWNPVGMALTGYLYPLQFSSVVGVFGLSFLVILTNLLALRAWCSPPRLYSTVGWASIFLLPFVYGIIHFHTHLNKLEESAKNPENKLTALLIQTSFPIEESMAFIDFESLREYVLKEWKQILTILTKQDPKGVDLIVLPENVVPFATYYSVFPADIVHGIFGTLFGKESLSVLPPLEEPLAMMMETVKGPEMMVSNAYFVQAISNLYKTGIVVGLEDVTVSKSNPEERYCFSAAYYFQPELNSEQRYEKRVLVPMGEYIPFECCKALAARYGVGGSFTCGTAAKVFQGKVPFGLSICYEETFGDLMRESRAKGAELLVNLTSDAWYPQSDLPKQHFDHARLRAVENGIPLIRSCNTGITGAFDSLGRVVAILEKDGEVEDISDALRVEVPLYHYKTLYSRFGDFPVILLSALLALFALGFNKNKAE